MNIMELVPVLAIVHVTIFLQQILAGSNESLLDISSKREGGKLLHFNVFGLMLHSKEHETGIWDIIPADLAGDLLVPDYFSQWDFGGVMEISLLR